MPQTAASSPENKRYNDESSLLDGLHEFHPEFFDALTDRELQILQTYYLTGRELPENIFEYRRQLIRQQPQIENEAHKAFNKLLSMAGMSTE